MPRIMVSGYIDVEDHQFDAGPLGPLTQRAFDEVRDWHLSSLEDLEFTLADADDR